MNREIFICGGGYSLQGFNFNKLKNKTTIAVNKSHSYVPNLDYFITIDFTALRKIKPVTSAVTKIFVANFSVSALQEIEGRIVDTRWNLVYDLKNFDLVVKSRKAEGIGLTFKDFRTGNNSGYCALQFAIVMGFNPIYLLGIDLVAPKATHFHSGYNESIESFRQKLKKYYDNFVIGINELKIQRPDIKIVSCSKISKLNTIIEYKSLDKVLK